MLWSELWNKENEPNLEQIQDFVNTPLLDDLITFLNQEFEVRPKLFYSGCPMDNGIWKGWNIKFKKTGKSLCTIYPQQGYLLSLVPVGNKEMHEVDILAPAFDPYTQDLYRNTENHIHGKSLAIEIRTKSILDDVKIIIEKRVKTK